MSFLLTPLRRTSPTTLTALKTTTKSQLNRTFTSTPSPQVARMTMVGRLGTNPETRETSKGSIINYAIGTSYGPRDDRQTSWFRVASFAPEGSAQRDYLLGLTKGTLVYLEGDATMKTYEDADGKKQSSLSLVQTKIEVLKRPVPKDEEVATDGL